MRSIHAFAAAAILLATASANAATPNLEYYGGPVISNVQVYEVYWGPNVDATIKGQIDAFWTTIVASPYIDWLGEYDTVGLVSKSDGDAGTTQRIRRGTYGGAITITPANSNTTLTLADIRAELQAQITAKILPAPTTDSGGNVNTYFAVDFPKGITIDAGLGGKSCTQFCSMFDDVAVGAAHVAVTYDPYVNSDGPCSTGCFGSSNQYFQAVTRVHSGDLLNVITGPRSIEALVANSVVRPVGWYSQSGDPGTIIYNNTCSTKAGTLDSYFVQFGWSNRLNNCVDEDPTLPLCDGTKHPCRPCASTQLDGGAPDCTGTTCETTAGNANQGLCVACTADATCGAGKICDRSTDTCVTAPPDAGSDSGSDASSGSDAGQGADAGTGGGGGGCSCDASPDASTVLSPLLFFGVVAAARARRSRK